MSCQLTTDTREFLKTCGGRVQQRVVGVGSGAAATVVRMESEVGSRGAATGAALVRASGAP
jgi:hypothetical protein